MIERSILRFILGASLMLPVTANAEVFSIVLLTDSQFYAEQHPEILEAQIDWIVTNEGTENIIYVAQTGDLKDDQFCDNKTVNVGTGAGRTEWQIVDQAFSDLDTAGIAYGVVPGNHDFNPVSGFCPNWTTQRPLSEYNTNFGPGRFAGDPYYGDPGAVTPGNRVTGSNEDNFTLFDSNDVEFIAINLAYKPAPDAIGLGNAELAWADNLLKTYPDRLGILTSHYFMETNPGNNLGPYGQEVYDTLSNNPNLFMMLSGHWYGEAWLTETTGRAGLQPTQIMMSNYQDQFFPTDTDPVTPPNTPNPALIDFSNIANVGGTDSGFMRIMRFDTDTGMVDIETFIPPVVPIKNRTGTLVSTYFPASGAGMGRGTASNLSVPFYGYGFGYIPPTEMLGLRVSTGTGGATILLTFSAVKSLSTLEDRTIVHFDLDSYPTSFSSATLNIGVSNIDDGPGTLDVFSFSGDGTVSIDEWNTGTLLQTVAGIGDTPETLVVDITGLLSTAIANGDSYLSFRLSTTDTPPDFNRYWLDATVGGVTTPISAEGPTFISITP